MLAAAIKTRSEVPSRSTRTLIDALEMQQLVPPGKLKRSTLDRHLEAAGASRRRLKTLGNKVFTRLLFEHPNDLRQQSPPRDRKPITWARAMETLRDALRVAGGRREATAASRPRRLTPGTAAPRP